MPVSLFFYLHSKRSTGSESGNLAARPGSDKQSLPPSTNSVLSPGLGSASANLEIYWCNSDAGAPPRPTESVSKGEDWISEVCKSSPGGSDVHTKKKDHWIKIDSPGLRGKTKGCR